MIDGSVSNENLLAFHADEGSFVRRIAIPVIGIVGFYLLCLPQLRPCVPTAGLVTILVAYVAWCFLSALWSDDPDITLRRLTVLLFLVVGACGVARLDTRSIRTMLICIVLATLAVGLINELVLGTFAPWRSDYRFSGTVHPNLQAASAAQLALIGLACVLDPAVRRRWVGPALIVTGAGVILLTQSRTSLLSLVLAAAFMVALTARGRITPVLLVLAAIFPLAATIFSALDIFGMEGSPAAALMAMLERPRDQGNIQALTGRIDIWETCIRIAMERPLIGAGFESFWTPQRIVEISSIHNWGINQAHSVYIEHLVSLGLIGLLLWCSLVFLALFASAQHYMSEHRHSMLWIAGQIAYCIIHGLNEAINMLPSFNGYVLFILIAHLALFAKERAKR
jgi:O-antigen ligase